MVEDDIIGLTYSQKEYKIVSIFRNSSYETMKEKVFDKIGLSREGFSVKFTCRLPCLDKKYIAVHVEDDDSLETMLAVTDEPGRLYVEMYCQIKESVVERSYSRDVQPDLGEFTQYSQLLSGGLGDENVGLQPSVYDFGVNDNSMIRPLFEEDNDEEEDPDYIEEGEDEDEEDPDYCGEYEEDENEEDDEQVEGDFSRVEESGVVEDVGVNSVGVWVPEASFMTMLGTDALYKQNKYQNAIYPGSWNPEHEEPFVGLLFKSQELMKKAMKLWSIQRKVNFATTYSKSTYWDIRCKLNGDSQSCLWRFRACQRKKSGLWEVTIYDGPHTCIHASMSSSHRQLDSNLIAQIIGPSIANDPSTKVSAIRQTIFVRFERTVTYRKAWLGKQKAIASIYGDWEKSYAILPKFMRAIQKYNPGTVVDFHTVAVHDRADRYVGQMFDNFFFTFPPVVAAFLHCRPVIVIDATHMYGKYKGKILLAMAVDANNSTFPLACAFVDEESDDTWGFFLDRLLYHVIGTRKDICLISDRHRGILSSVSRVWEPMGHVHRYCVRHFLSNFKSKFKGEPELYTHVGGAIWAYQQKNFDKSMESLQQKSTEAYEWLMAEPLEKWSRLHDKGRRYGIMTSNDAESFNSVLVSARSLPITAAVQVIFLRCVEYFVNRKRTAANMRRRGSVYCADFWEGVKGRVEKKSNFQTAYDSMNVYSVTTYNRWGRGKNVQRVNIRERTCDCGKWQSDGFPCSHLIGVCEIERIEWQTFVSPYYKIDMYEATYAPVFNPLADEAYWEAARFILMPNPSRARSVGRPKGRIRNGMDVSKRREGITCSSCNGRGHDSRTCPQSQKSTRQNYPIGVRRR